MYLFKKFLIAISAGLLFLSLSACAQDTTQAIDEKAKSGMSDEQADAWFEAEQDDGKVTFTIGEHILNVEYADTPDERALGLMFRREMCTDCGMLFKFDSERIGSIWMKNTYLPLDLAYIDASGKITDILALQPHDLTPVRSSSKVLYALEMNQGWFASKDIRVGDDVKMLP